MVATLGRWEIRTNLSKHLGSEAIRIFRFEAAQRELLPSAPDLEQVAGDFIARHVLERDAEFFEG